MITKYKNTNQFWLDDNLVDIYLKLLSGNELKVWVTITRHFNTAGNTFVSIRKISEKCKIHHTTTNKCLRKLEALCLLEKLEIKEKYKTRYTLSKSARFLIPGTGKVLVKPDTKEHIKELFYIEDEKPEKVLTGLNNLFKDRQCLVNKMNLANR